MQRPALKSWTRARLNEVRTVEAPTAFRAPAWVRAVVLLGALALSPGCADSPSRAWEVATQGIYTGALSPNGTQALVGSMNHGGSLWQLPAGERLYNWNHAANSFSELVATAFSADGTRAATSDPKTLVLWDTTSGASLGFWSTPAAVLDVALTPSGDRVLMGMQDHSAVLIDATTGDHQLTLLHEGVVNAVDIDTSGGRAITGADDNSAIVWRLDDGSIVTRLKQGNPVREVAISPAGNFAFTAVQSEAVSVWNVPSGKLNFELHARNRGVMSAEFSADETRLLVGYVNNRIELWDVQSGRLLRSWTPTGKAQWTTVRSAVLSVSFSASGRYYALTGDGSVVELS